MQRYGGEIETNDSSGRGAMAFRLIICFYRKGTG
jgi:hypothetical protein